MTLSSPFRYEADHVYALNTVYFLCATVFVFAVAHFASRYAPARVRRSSLWQKGTAAGRFLSYKGFRIPGLGYWAGSAGVAALIAVGAVFFFGTSSPSTASPSHSLHQSRDNYRDTDRGSDDSRSSTVLLAKHRYGQFRRQPAYCDQDGVDGCCVVAVCIVRPHPSLPDIKRACLPMMAESSGPKRI